MQSFTNNKQTGGKTAFLFRVPLNTGTQCTHLKAIMIQSEGYIFGGSESLLQEARLRCGTEIRSRRVEKVTFGKHSFNIRCVCFRVCVGVSVERTALHQFLGSRIYCLSDHFRCVSFTLPLPPDIQNGPPKQHQSAHPVLVGVVNLTHLKQLRARIAHRGPRSGFARECLFRLLRVPAWVSRI